MVMGMVGCLVGWSEICTFPFSPFSFLFLSGWPVGPFGHDRSAEIDLPAACPSHLRVPARCDDLVCAKQTVNFVF